MDYNNMSCIKSTATIKKKLSSMIKDNSKVKQKKRIKSEEVKRKKSI